jgi:two-component system, NtrC family, sensor histidine kinase HydH
MSIAASAPVQEDEVERVTQGIIVKLFKYRFLISFLLAFALAVFFIWDPVPWKLTWIACVLLFLLGVSIIEYRRVRRSVPGPLTVQLNLLVMMLAQAAMVYITGGIESPLLPVFLPMAYAAGHLLPSLARILPILAAGAGLLVFFALASLHGLVPRAAPAFFELGSGFGDMPVYVWTKAGVLTLLMAVIGVISHTVRRALQGQVRQSMAVRQASVDELHQRNRELLSASRTLAHELKNPLASIQGLAQLLARGVEPGSKLGERLEVMQREIARMGEVLEGFRNFTRPLSGLHLARTDLASLARDVLQLHEGIAARRGIQQELAASPTWIECDPAKLRQALINLVQNALEAAPQGGRVVVRVGAWSQAAGPSGARLEVQDSGPGLSPEVRSHLFEPGFTTKPEGSGIGLLVARSIALQHGGSLELSDAASGGGLAVLQLPWQPAREGGELA